MARIIGKSLGTLLLSLITHGAVYDPDSVRDPNVGGRSGFGGRLESDFGVAVRNLIQILVANRILVPVQRTARIVNRVGRPTGIRILNKMRRAARARQAFRTKPLFAHGGSFRL